MIRRIGHSVVHPEESYAWSLPIPLGELVINQILTPLGAVGRLSKPPPHVFASTRPPLNKKTESAQADSVILIDMENASANAFSGLAIAFQPTFDAHRIVDARVFTGGIE